jgi:hypothetical protein
VKPTERSSDCLLRPLSPSPISSRSTKPCALRPHPFPLLSSPQVLAARVSAESLATTPAATSSPFPLSDPPPSLLSSPQVLAARVSVESVWDQSAYNQEIFRLSHANQRAPGVSVRTMNYMCFLNTKFLFRYMRKDPQLIDRGSHVPVSCHVNYRALPNPASHPPLLCADRSWPLYPLPSRTSRPPLLSCVTRSCAPTLSAGPAHHPPTHPPTYPLRLTPSPTGQTPRRRIACSRSKPIT